MNVFFFNLSLRLPNVILYTLQFLCVSYMQSLWKLADCLPWALGRTLSCP